MTSSRVQQDDQLTIKMSPPCLLTIPDFNDYYYLLKQIQTRIYMSFLAFSLLLQYLRLKKNMATGDVGGV